MHNLLNCKNAWCLVLRALCLMQGLVPVAWRVVPGAWLSLVPGASCLVLWLEEEGEEGQDGRCGFPQLACGPPQLACVFPQLAWRRRNNGAGWPVWFPTACVRVSKAFHNK